MTKVHFAFCAMTSYKQRAWGSDEGRFEGILQVVKAYFIAIS